MANKVFSRHFFDKDSSQKNRGQKKSVHFPSIYLTKSIDLVDYSHSTLSAPFLFNHEKSCFLVFIFKFSEIEQVAVNGTISARPVCVSVDDELLTF
jgi:hypothetical protein